MQSQGTLFVKLRVKEADMLTLSIWPSTEKMSTKGSLS